MPAIFRVHGALPQLNGERQLLPCSCRFMRMKIVNRFLGTEAPDQAIQLTG